MRPAVGVRQYKISTILDRTVVFSMPVTHKVSFLQVGGLKSLGLNSMTFYDYEDLQETIKELNRKDPSEVSAGT